VSGRSQARTIRNRLSRRKHRKQDSTEKGGEGIFYVNLSILLSMRKGLQIARSAAKSGLCVKLTMERGKKRRLKNHSGSGPYKEK